MFKRKKTVYLMDCGRASRRTRGDQNGLWQEGAAPPFVWTWGEIDF
jgi:hypothetical protein